MGFHRAYRSDHLPTARQVEVLRCYVEHGTYEDVARSLEISVETVRHHLSSLRERLNVRTNAQAVYALWVGPDLEVGLDGDVVTTKGRPLSPLG